VIDTFPDLVEAVQASPAATLEQSSQLGWRRPEDER